MSSRSTRSCARRTCASTSTRTAAWRDCGCGGRRKRGGAGRRDVARTAAAHTPGTEPSLPLSRSDRRAPPCDARAAQYLPRRWRRPAAAVGASGARRVTQALAAHLNALSEPQARATLARCCGASRWVERMLAARPFTDDAAVHTTAEWTWWELPRDEGLLAFNAHPRIGERPREEWADREQAGTRTPPPAPPR